ncbi:hypothetical protein AB0D29_13955 [Streptomyces sp. NPDC048424]|uniref:hypothetical protein n=1 Tax=Streptomyces sp. NPDC048424 TaxID=3155265 RepID=UPI00342E6E7A
MKTIAISTAGTVVGGLILAAILGLFEGGGEPKQEPTNTSSTALPNPPTTLLSQPPSPSPSPSPSPPPPPPPPPPTTEGTPSTPAVHAWWEVRGCRMNRDYGHPQLTGTVYVKNKDPLNEHTYKLLVTFGDDENRIATNLIYVDFVKPLETGENQIIEDNPSAGAKSVPNGPISCRVAEISDYDTGGAVKP